MAELEDSLHRAVVVHSAAGDELADEEQYDEALASYEAAWELLPSPKTDWEAATWLLAAIGDVAFLKGDYSLGRKTLMEAMKHCAGATGNPFLRLRLGQCLFELGELQSAEDWLAGALAIEGSALFDDEDPKYIGLVLPKMKPPPVGW